MKQHRYCFQLRFSAPILSPLKNKFVLKCVSLIQHLKKLETASLSVNIGDKTYGDKTYGDTPGIKQPLPCFIKLLGLHNSRFSNFQLVDKNNSLAVFQRGENFEVLKCMH